MGTNIEVHLSCRVLSGASKETPVSHLEFWPHFNTFCVLLDLPLDPYLFEPKTPKDLVLDSVGLLKDTMAETADLLSPSFLKKQQTEKTFPTEEESEAPR